jgi:hypothetical protein
VFDGYLLRPCFLPPPLLLGVAFLLPVLDAFAVSALGFLRVVRFLAAAIVMSPGAVGYRSNITATTATTTASSPLG